MAKGVTYAQKFTGMAVGLTTFICCAAIFVRTRGDMNLNTLIYALSIVVPAALLVGTSSYLMGCICDSKNKKKKLNKFIK